MRLSVVMLLLLSGWLKAGGIRGVIRSDDGKPLAFASIYIKGNGNGAASDQSGHYEISLAPGTYVIQYQYLGYESQTEKITVGDGWVEKNVVLRVQNVQLQSVTVQARREDPAYAVMRRAIARARYHQVQVDSFSATVYIKGKGKLRDYPWLAKKMLEKEGITKDRLFIQESVSEIHYERPNRYKEKVIAIYTQGKNNTSGPNEYVFGSLYEPELAETVSPLSPKAFSYYKFEYLGFFKDQGVEVNKIKVIPRSPGDRVFSGIISIVEDTWSIHSVDLNTSRLGVKVNMKSVYNPVVAGASQVWMPVNQQFRFDGSVFGFDFEGQYLATVRNYKVYLNATLKPEVVITDSKQQEKPLPAPKTPTSRPVNRVQKNEQTKEKLENGQEVSDKDLARLMKRMEREEAVKQNATAVESDRTFLVDKSARKQDSVFWAQLRPAPLETEELRGYVQADSFAIVEKKKEEGDSLKNSKHKGFQLYDLVVGDRYRLSKTQTLEVRVPYGGFNTVEGFYGLYRLRYVQRWVKRDTLHPEKAPQVTRLELMPVLRYSFARERFYPLLEATFINPRNRLVVGGGRFVQQLNPNDPIHPMVNTLGSLLWGDNYMKLLERDFVELKWRHRFNDHVVGVFKGSWNDRKPLTNNSDYTFFENLKDRYTSNVPENAELSDTRFPQHQAAIASIGIEARPWQKYRIRNGRKYRVDGAPLITLTYSKAFKDLLGSDVNYNLLEAGVRQGVKLGYRGRLDYNFLTGIFAGSSRLYFPDFHHFAGNRVPLITSDPVSSFRLLDYYKLSTADRYVNVGANYHFRKFLVSRIPKLQLIGVRENVFGGWLWTPDAGWYGEAGFGIDGILRVLRVEIATSFTQGLNPNASLPQRSGLRIGVIGNLGY